MKKTIFLRSRDYLCKVLERIGDWIDFDQQFRFLRCINISLFIVVLLSDTFNLNFEITRILFGIFGATWTASRSYMYKKALLVSEPELRKLLIVCNIGCICFGCCIVLNIIAFYLPLIPVLACIFLMFICLVISAVMAVYMAILILKP